MDYTKLYENLISTRKALNRNPNDGNYYEKHHIIPISCGGSDDKDNLILLTFKEHYLAHLFLTYIYPSGKHKRSMYYALWRMSSKSKNHAQRILSASQYETCRKAGLIAKLGHPVKTDTRAKISIAHKGKKLSEKTKKLLSSINTGKKRGSTPIETRLKIGASNKGKIRTPEANENNRLRNIGRKQSEETREKRSKKLLGKARPQDVKDRINQNNTQKKPIICSNGITYAGINIAAKELNLNQPNISAVCYGRRKSTKGYSFKFKT